MTFIIGTPHAKGAGYYMNDDRASGGKKAEADIKTCPHCQAIIKMQGWDVVGDKGAWCNKCFAPICKSCGHKMKIYGCSPFIKQIEEQMERSETLAQFMKIAGLEPPGPPPQEIYTGFTNK